MHLQTEHSIVNTCSETDAYCQERQLTTRSKLIQILKLADVSSENGNRQQRWKLVVIWILQSDKQGNVSTTTNALLSFRSFGSRYVLQIPSVECTHTQWPTFLNLLHTGLGSSKNLQDNWSRFSKRPDMHFLSHQQQCKSTQRNTAVHRDQFSWDILNGTEMEQYGKSVSITFEENSSS